jgi:DNA-binding NarL/FixJ family response regulator
METSESTQHIRLLIGGQRLPEGLAVQPLLARQQAIKVVGEAVEMAQVIKAICLVKPDVILLHAMSVDSTLQTIRTILSHAPSAALLLVTDATNTDTDTAIRMLEHGARGLLAPADIHAQGLRAIHAVYAGELWGSRAVLSQIAQRTIRHTALAHAHEKSASTLTERESEIATLLRSGASNKQIAAQLRISDKTVKTHLQNIFGKMQIHRRQQIPSALLLS